MYRVIFHRGGSIDLKTKVRSGRAEITSDSLRISGPSAFELPFKSVRAVELVRLHGLGRMVKLSGNHGALFISVTRLNLCGYFVIGNFRATGELYRCLEARCLG